MTSAPSVAAANGCCPASAAAFSVSHDDGTMDALCRRGKRSTAMISSVLAGRSFGLVAMSEEEGAAAEAGSEVRKNAGEVLPPPSPVGRPLSPRATTGD